MLLVKLTLVSIPGEGTGNMWGPLPMEYDTAVRSTADGFRKQRVLLKKGRKEGRKRRGRRRREERQRRGEEGREGAKRE